MKHHIIVKWNPEGKAVDGLYQKVFELFQESLEIDGVHGVSLHPSVIDRQNRYDLMICIEMDRDALARFDESSIHARWKVEYGGYLEAKAIFDCD